MLGNGGLDEVYLRLGNSSKKLDAEQIGKIFLDFFQVQESGL